MYLCNRLKLCRCSNECGNECVLTKDRNYAMIPQKGQALIVNNVKELNWWLEVLRQTEIDYKVEGFKILFMA